MTRHSRTFWEKLVAEVERGREIGDVAARYGVRPRTLGWWRWSLGRRGGARVRTPRLLPVVVGRPAERREARMIQIAVGAAMIRIEEGADVTYVAALVGALRSSC